MIRRFARFAKLALVVAVLGLLCGWLLVGCGHHHKHRAYVTNINLDQPLEVDEFIGTLAICWPDSWTEEQRADARRGILAHLNAWEAEFGLTVAPAKLIIFLSGDELGGINLEDRSIIIVAPGECYEFEALFNLLTHHYLTDLQERDPRWQRWNALGAEIAKEIRDLCLVTHPPAPEPPPTPDPDDDGEDPDDDDDDDDLDKDEKRCKRLYRKWLKKCRPHLHKWLKKRHGKWWHRHWHKHWRPRKKDKKCKKLLEILHACGQHEHSS